MIDFIRNLSKPTAEKRQERANAYLDGALSAQERRKFEADLQRDAELRAELEALRWVKLSVQQAPRLRAPRNFILDPALYGQRARAGSGWSLYPALRVATALTAFFFILALALDLATPRGALNQPLLSGQGDATVAMEEAPRQADDVAMLAVPEEETAGSLEEDAGNLESAREPAPTAAEAEGERVAEEETALFAATPGADVGAAADEAASEMADEPQLPGASAPLEVTGEAAPDEPAADEAPVEVGPQTPALEESAAEEIAVQEAPGTPDAPAPSLPLLLLAEIVLGAALVMLAIATLIARRGA